MIDFTIDKHFHSNLFALFLLACFRLVIDRETGKPKGYGFCEYKDEETALSARRNLQGYEINGRQLRVDFAENDKGSDRNREQVTVTELLYFYMDTFFCQFFHHHDGILLSCLTSAAVHCSFF